MWKPWRGCCGASGRRSGGRRWPPHIFMLVIIKDKLTDLCGNRLLQNVFMNRLCEINLVEERGSLGAVRAESLVGCLEKNDGIFALSFQLFDLLLQRLFHPVLPRNRLLVRPMRTSYCSTHQLSKQDRIVLLNCSDVYHTSSSFGERQYETRS